MSLGRLWSYYELQNILGATCFTACSQTDKIWWTAFLKWLKALCFKQLHRTIAQSVWSGSCVKQYIPLQAQKNRIPKRVEKKTNKQYKRWLSTIPIQNSRKHLTGYLYPHLIKSYNVCEGAAYHKHPAIFANREGELINFPPLKRGRLLERGGGLFERGGLIEDLREYLTR